MEQQDIVFCLALFEDGSDAGQVVVEGLVVWPPGLVPEEAGRIVTLAEPPETVAFEVLADEVHAVDKLPLDEPLQVREGDCPAAERKCLR